MVYMWYTFLFGFFYSKYSYFMALSCITLQDSLFSTNSFQGHCYHLYEGYGTKIDKKYYVGDFL